MAVVRKLSNRNIMEGKTMRVKEHTGDKKGIFLCQLCGNSLGCIWMDSCGIHNNLVSQVAGRDNFCRDGL